MVFSEQKAVYLFTVVLGFIPIIFFFQAEDGIRDHCVTGVQTCALPISSRRRHTRSLCDWSSDVCSSDRSEEHTSELQSHSDLVCRLLLDWSSDMCSSDRSEEHTSELQSYRDLECRLLLGKTNTCCPDSY